jgi:hypothetical protein
VIEGMWTKKEGLFEYSIKRLPQNERLDAVFRLSKMPMSDDLRQFLNLGKQ